MAVQDINVRYVVDVADIDKAEKAMGNLTDENKRAANSLKTTGAEGGAGIRRVGDEAQNAGKKVSTMGDLAKKAGGILVAFFAADRIKDFVGQVFNATAQFQKLSAVLTNTLGSQSKARRAMQDIQDFASSTPFSVNEITESFVKLVNQGFVPTKEQMRQMGDLAASQGKTFDELTEAILDGQRGEFERLKNFGITASKQGEQVQLTFKGVTTIVKNSQDAIRGYLLGLGDIEGVFGGMAAVSRTLGGQLSNLGDSFDKLLITIGKRFQDAFADALGATSSLVSGFQELIDVPLSDELIKEQGQLNAIVGALQQTNMGTETRKMLIQDLQAQYPEFLKNLDAETVTNAELAARLNEVNLQYNRKIFFQKADEERSKIAARYVDLIRQEADVLTEIETLQNKIKEGSFFASPQDIGKLQGDLKRIRKEQSETLQEQEEFNQKINKIAKDRFSSQNDLQKQADELKEKDKARVAEYLKEREAEIEAERKAALEAAKASRIVLEARLKDLDEETKATELFSARREQILTEQLAIRQQIAQIDFQLSKQELVDKTKLNVELVQNAKETQRALLELERERVLESAKIRNSIAEKGSEVLGKIADKEAQKEADNRKKVWEAYKDSVDAQIKERQRQLDETAKLAQEEREKEEMEREAIKNFAFEAFQQTTDFLFEQQQTRIQNQLTALTQQRDAELAANEGNEQAQAFIREKYRKKENELKRRTAEQEKQKALFDVLVQTSVNAVKAFPNPVLIALAIAQGAVQAALIKSRPIPKFNKGTKSVPGVDTGSDSVLAMLRPGEGVMPVDRMSDYRQTFNAMFDRSIPADALNGFVMNYGKATPSRSDYTSAMVDEIRQLRKEVKGLKKQGNFIVNVDKNGHSIYLEEQRQRVQILNSVYNC